MSRANSGDRREKKRRTKSFPEKLLSSMMQHAMGDDAVAWLPDGKSFVVVNADLFVEQILRPTFKECKYSSFVRKLHRWGFVRLTSGTGTDCFHHPLFQKGRIDLAAKVNCGPREKDGTIKGVGSGGKPPSLAGVERFIRAKTVATAFAAATVTNNEKARAPSPLEQQERHLNSEANAASGIVGSVIPSTIVEEDEDLNSEDNGVDNDSEPEPFSSTPAVY